MLLKSNHSVKNTKRSLCGLYEEESDIPAVIAVRSRNVTCFLFGPIFSPFREALLIGSPAEKHEDRVVKRLRRNVRCIGGLFGLRPAGG